MKSTTTHTLTLLIGTALLLGPPSLQPRLHSQQSADHNSEAASVNPNRGAETTATATTDSGTSTNLVEKIADLTTLQTNDPFANTFAMLKRAASDNPVTSTLSALSGSADLQLRGTIRDAADGTLALVEVGQTGVHVVRVGDTLSLSGGGRRANVTILAIHRQSIEVEYGNFEDAITIR